MPFASKAQEKFAFATKQPWAKEWASKTDQSSLPNKVSKQSKLEALKRASSGGK